MNPKTFFRSMMMRRMASEANYQRQCVKGRKKRTINGPVVHYFHQVDDPYSHLAVHKLPALASLYPIKWQGHVVSSPKAEYQGDASRFYDWTLNDASAVASAFGVTFQPDGPPSPEQISLATGQMVGALNQENFTDIAAEISSELWQGNLSTDRPSADQVDEALASGTELRNRLGHYWGGMFYFEGEWFWGVDRLHHLERRLRAEGFCTNPGEDLVCPPPAASGSVEYAQDITLEYFPSLRSPYTAIAHARVQKLVNRTGVNLVLRPVMPMMMRGIPAPMNKGRYILTDTAREARFHNVPFGRIVDPFGDPVRRAFSLFPRIHEEGFGMEYIGAYLSAAFAEGIDITTQAGLTKIIKQIGLPGKAADYVSADWQQLVETNVADMLNAGLWGVPSFRVSGGNSEASFACWGQDRIWRVEQEIINRQANHD